MTESDTLLAANPALPPPNPRIPPWLGGTPLVAAALLILVVILWLPFGFSVPFWADGWPSTVTADQGIVVLDDVRPLVYAPWALARLLSPNLFANVNLFIAGAIFGKGFLLYLILNRLTRSQPLAFAAAALVIVFPVDTAIFNEGTMSIHVALFCYLVAVYALLAYWQRPRWFWLPLIGLALLVTTGIYETVYPLILFTPLILLYTQPKISRRFVLVALLWYVVPLLVALRFVFLITRQDDSAAYQSGLFTSVGLSTALDSLLRAYARHFWTSWEYFAQSYRRYGFAAGAIALVSVLVLSRRALFPSQKRLLILTLAGLAVLGLGYAPYLFTALRESTNRTFFYSSVGAALSIAALLLLLITLIPLRRVIFVIFPVAVAVLVGLGTMVSLDRHQVNFDKGMSQVPVLRAVTDQVPALTPGALLLVIDETEEHMLRGTFTQASSYLARALQVLYEDPTFQAAICYPDDQTGWGHFAETCQLKSDGVTHSETERGTRHFTYDQIVAFSYATDGTLTLLESLAPYALGAVGYAPNQLILFDAPASPRPSILLAELSENSP